jgi:capsular exopolysaccharide synthesis family protein
MAVVDRFDAVMDARAAGVRAHSRHVPEQDTDTAHADAGTMVLPHLHAAQGLSGKLVILPDARPALVEQYRKLAATLHFVQTERPIRTVMVASSISGEGKTFTASNLALTLSESYSRRVLLVDADLRRPSVHNVFRIPNHFGLSDELAKEGDDLPVVREMTPTLSILTGGRPDSDPMSGLISSRMKKIIELASAEYDWVIVDTPPVGLLSDAKLLAGMVDAAVLVIAAGSTPYELIKRATETLGRRHILGVVLNRVSDRVEAGGYNYYGYYGAYGAYAARK